MTMLTQATGPLIRLDEFEGPLDLLLQLVERRRLPIAELSLATVADQYLAQVRALDTIPPDALSEFLALAARLLLLKSRALLPAIEPPALGADQDEAASAEELVRRLEAYRTFKAVAEQFRDLDAAGATAFAHGARERQSDGLQAPLQAIAPAALASLMAAIERRGVEARADAADPPRRTSVQERIGLLRALLGRRRVVAWEDVAGTTVDEIVATLLAVLELVRRGELAVVQAALFGPIRLQALASRPDAVGASADG